MKTKSTKCKLAHHACEEKGYDFVPFVMTTDGAIGPAAQKSLARLATILSEKWRMAEGVVKGWTRARFAMAIAGASHACMRVNRNQPYSYTINY